LSISPTSEQQLVIDGSPHFIKKKESVMVLSLPGTGKTSLLKEIVQENPKSKFIYIVFSREGANSSREAMPKNCEVVNLHALARKSIDLHGVDIVSRYSTSRTAKLLKTTLGNGSKVNKLLEQYFTSDELGFTEFAKKRNAADVIITHATTMLFMMSKREIDITPSFFLKEYSLKIFQGKKVGKFDCLLVDEYQDANGVAKSIYKNIGNLAKIYVGDDNQAIFGFMGAHNAISQTQTDRSYVLTVNFRSSPEVISVANDILINFSGSKEVIKTSDTIKKKTGVDAILTRTNAEIIKYIDLYDDFSIVKSAEELFALPIILANWKKGNWEDVPKQHYYLKQIHNDKELKEYSAKTGNQSLMSSFLLCKKYSLEKLLELKEKTEKSFSKKGKTKLLTAHTAKGLEFDNVRLAGDFPNLFSLARKVKRKESTRAELKEEVALYFVAVTRAIYSVTDKTPNLTLTTEQKHFIRDILCD